MSIQGKACDKAQFRHARCNVVFMEVENRWEADR